ncbi:MAG: S1 RNA-binding domain-containing protein [Candidatus Aenigmatarchaeota archaeon]
MRRFGAPKKNELVICIPKDISPFSITCSILEYSEFTGIININEVYTRWIEDIREYVKIGKTYIAKVLDVDEAKKIAILSLKRVKKDEEEKKKEELRLEKKYEKILELAAKKLGKTLEDAYKEFGYKILENFETLYNFFINHRDKLSEYIPKEWLEIMQDFLDKKEEKNYEITYIIKISTFQKEGVNKIKEFFSQFEKNGIKITYLGAGKFLAKKNSKNPKKDEKMMLNLIESGKEIFEVYEYKKREKN